METIKDESTLIVYDESTSMDEVCWERLLKYLKNKFSVRLSPGERK